MALQLQHELGSLTIPNAYLRIVAVTLSRSGGFVSVAAEILASAADAKHIDIYSTNLPYTPDANVAWAYNQLKTLPEFAGAVDV